MATSNFADVYISHNVEGTDGNLCEPDLGAKVKGQIMYFIVNASAPKLLDVAASNFAGA